MKIIILSVLLFSNLAFAEDCIFSNRIRGFDVESPTSLRIDAGNEDYLMTVGYCSELEWTHKIGFETFSSSRVCRNDRLLVLDNGSSQIKQKCFIRKIVRIQ